MSTTLLILGGIYNLAFAIFHILFWKIFRWKADLQSLTHINRGIMQILNLRLIYVFLVFAAVSFCFSATLLSTELGKFILISISLFWFTRAIEQLVFFGAKRWASVTFILIFVVGGLLYVVPALGE